MNIGYLLVKFETIANVAIDSSDNTPKTAGFSGDLRIVAKNKDIGYDFEVAPHIEVYSNTGTFCKHIKMS